VRGVLGSLDQRTLRPEEDLPDLADGEDESDVAVLLVPDADGPARAALLRTLRGHQAHVGPPRPWTDARASSLRVLRARRLRLSTGGDEPLDTERHLTALVVGADPAALADLRRQVLAPFADLRPATADRLAETLREWLLHQGRRDDVAAALHVHPQTVRYRMGQVRELFGDRLLDPGTVAALTVALANDRDEPSDRSASERTPASG
jgi:DNA-binding PucR family transcriptional regulator